MQNAAFRFGLNLLFFSLLASAGAENLAEKCNPANPQSKGCQQQKPPEQVGASPVAGQSPRPTIISADKPTAPGDHHNSDDEPKRREGASLSDARETKAAEIQAHYSRRQFQIGIASAFVGALAAVFTGWAAWAAAAAAKAANKSTKQASEALAHAKQVAETDQRAWINIEIAPGSDFQFTDTGIHFFAHVVARNIGKMPAYDVWCAAIISLRTKSGISKTITDYAINSIANKAKFVGVIMPGDSRPVAKFGLIIMQKDIYENIIYTESGLILPNIICVADYKISTSSDIFHKTAFIYDVLKKSPSGAMFIIRDDGDVPKELVAINNTGLSIAT